MDSEEAQPERAASRRVAGDTFGGVPDDLQLERIDGELVVTWRGAIDELCLSATPDERGEPIALGEHATVVLADVDASVRHYVHARVGERWLVAGERLVPLEGTLNCRDLGGYRTADGALVRWGQVFRSEGLHGLTDGDHRVLEGIGVRTVCDLRGAREHEAQPSALPATVERISVGVEPARPGEATLDERIIAGEVAGLTVDDVVELYELMLLAGARSFGAALEHVASADRPVLFHCTAGKDRTGIVAALLLALLGVPDEVVFDDYMLTKRYRSERRLEELRSWLAEHDLALEPFEALYIPQRETIVRTIETLRSEHGSLDAFVTGPGQAAPDLPDRLRERLLLR
jgi:protein-tyrosine phosphatase